MARGRDPSCGRNHGHFRGVHRGRSRRTCRLRCSGADAAPVGNVYVIEHDDATDEWPHGNTGVIVGQTGLFVIDSCYLPSRAKADIALIRRVTEKPVRFLMTTHWHFDHNNGAIAYRDAFPGVTLIAERNTARWIELNQNYWKAFSNTPGSPRREALAKLEAELASGGGEDGKPFSPAEREQRAGVVAKRHSEFDELAALQVVTPTQLFDGRLSLDFEYADRNRGSGTCEFTERFDHLLPAARSCSPATSWSARRCLMSAHPGRCTGPRCCATSRRCPPR
jgi:hypothetical protein